MQINFAKCRLFLFAGIIISCIYFLFAFDNPYFFPPHGRCVGKNSNLESFNCYDTNQRKWIPKKEWLKLYPDDPGSFEVEGHCLVTKNFWECYSESEGWISEAEWKRKYPPEKIKYYDNSNKVWSSIKKNY